MKPPLHLSCCSTPVSGKNFLLSNQPSIRAGATRRRKRPRCFAKTVSWHFFALAYLALAGSPWTKRFVTSGAKVRLATRNETSDSESDGGPSETKPYRSTYGGRLKLVPNRKLIRVVATSATEDGRTSPWKKNAIIEGEPKGSELLAPSKPTLWTRASPYIKRGIILAGLTAIAVIDKSPPSEAVLETALSSNGASWLPSLRLNWNKLWSLPGEILPSLSAALMIAWIPNLVLQRAYFELAFLFCSLTTQPILRNYLVTEIFPSLGGTVRKLFWSEFWKQAWDYLLEPFPHNLLLPSKNSAPPLSSQNDVWSKWQADVAKFWSDRVVSRIDKWTASSVKAVLQKNVQASVNGLAEDSFKAVAYAWYPESTDKKRPTVQLPSNEDTARMIELECESDDRDCKEEIETEQTELESSLPENDAGKDTPTRDDPESSDDANTSLEPNDSSSPTVELREVSSFDDEPPIEEAVLSN